MQYSLWCTASPSSRIGNLPKKVKVRERRRQRRGASQSVSRATGRAKKSRIPRVNATAATAATGRMGALCSTHASSRPLSTKKNKNEVLYICIFRDTICFHFPPQHTSQHASFHGHVARMFFFCASGGAHESRLQATRPNQHPHSLAIAARHHVLDFERIKNRCLVVIRIHLLQQAKKRPQAKNKMRIGSCSCKVRKTACVPEYI